MDILNLQRYWNSTLPPTVQNGAAQNKVFMGGQSILIQSAAEASKYCGVVKNLPYLPTKRLGIEGFFAFEDWQYIEYIGFMIDRYTLTDFKAAFIRYKPLTVTTGKLQYATGSGMHACMKATSSMSE